MKIQLVAVQTFHSEMSDWRTDRHCPPLACRKIRWWDGSAKSMCWSQLCPGCRLQVLQLPECESNLTVSVSPCTVFCVWAEYEPVYLCLLWVCTCVCVCLRAPLPCYPLLEDPCLENRHTSSSWCLNSSVSLLYITRPSAVFVLHVRVRYCGVSPEVLK